MKKLSLIIASLFLVMLIKAQTTNYGTNSGTGGVNNANFGYSAGQVNTGNLNTCIGYMAGKSSTYSLFGTFVGANAGYNTTTGFRDCFFGYLAGGNNTTGSSNTFMGTYSGRYNTTGNYNTLLGVGSGFNNITGNNNVYLGDFAGFSNTKGSGNVFLGHNAGRYDTTSNKLYIANNPNSPLIYGDFSTSTLTFNGKVGIGCTNPAVALAVSGKVQATEIEIKATPCSDFVFETDYKLMNLPELEQFVKTNKHLPEIPSAKQFQENGGYNLTQMDDLLLRKVEELTLYVIELKKENEALKAKVDQLSH